MQPDGRPTADVERALLSAVDFSDNALDLMYVAKYMAQSGMEERAIQLFEEVAISFPSRPEAFIQTLDIADRTNDLDAARWASLGVLRQAWPSSQRNLEDKARRLAIAALHQLEKMAALPKRKSFAMSSTGP